jgi:hypothetical protein
MCAYDTVSVDDVYREMYLYSVNFMTYCLS